MKWIDECFLESQTTHALHNSVPGLGLAPFQSRKIGTNRREKTKVSTLTLSTICPRNVNHLLPVIWCLIVDLFSWIPPCIRRLGLPGMRNMKDTKDGMSTTQPCPRACAQRSSDVMSSPNSALRFFFEKPWALAATRKEKNASLVKLAMKTFGRLLNTKLLCALPLEGSKVYIFTSSLSQSLERVKSQNWFQSAIRTCSSVFACLSKNR